LRTASIGSRRELDSGSQTETYTTHVHICTHVYTVVHMLRNSLLFMSIVHSHYKLSQTFAQQTSYIKVTNKT